MHIKPTVHWDNNHDDNQCCIFYLNLLKFWKELQMRKLLANFGDFKVPELPEMTFN